MQGQAGSLAFDRMGRNPKRSVDLGMYWTRIMAEGHRDEPSDPLEKTNPGRVPAVPFSRDMNSFRTHERIAIAVAAILHASCSSHGSAPSGEAGAAEADASDGSVDGALEAASFDSSSPSDALNDSVPAVADTADETTGSIPSRGNTCPGTPADASTADVITLASGLDGPSSIAVDSTGVYWTDEYGGTVMSASFDGGTPATLASGQDNPNSVAVYAGEVYWTNGGDGTVATTPVGGGATAVLASLQAQPTGLAANGFGCSGRTTMATP